MQSIAVHPPAALLRRHRPSRARATPASAASWPRCRRCGPRSCLTPRLCHYILCAQPGSSLSSRENACLENCARRFVEATQYILQVCAPRAEPAQCLNATAGAAPIAVHALNTVSMVCIAAVARSARRTRRTRQGASELFGAGLSWTQLIDESCCLKGPGRLLGGIMGMPAARQLDDRQGRVIRLGRRLWVDRALWSARRLCFVRSRERSSAWGGRRSCAASALDVRLRCAERAVRASG